MVMVVEGGGGGLVRICSGNEYSNYKNSRSIGEKFVFKFVRSSSEGSSGG